MYGQSFGVVARAARPLARARGREGSAAQRPDSDESPKVEKSQAPLEVHLSMTPAVACKSIVGYEQYVALPEAVLSKDDKLLIYYCPLGFAIVPVGPKYQAHFVQDVRVRKRGEKTVVWSRDKLVDQKFEGVEPPSVLYLFNRISLKGLTPGDYDLDIILHDVHSKGATAEQTFRFKVKPTAAPPSTEADEGQSS